MRTVILAVFVGALLFSCSSKDDAGKRYVYYSNGRIKSVSNFVSDSMKSGLYSEYDSSGRLVRKIEYRNNFNIRDSSFDYRDNGTLQFVLVDVEETPTESFYYETGGKLRKYIAADVKGRKFCIVIYDSLGKGKSIYGQAISQVTGATEPLIKVNDSSTVKFYLAKPPGYKTFAMIGVYKFQSLDDTSSWYVPKALIKEFEKIDVTGSVISYTTSFGEIGNFAVMCVNEVIDLEKPASVLRDTGVCLIQVR